MQIPKKEQITFKQFVFYIYKTQIGIGVLTLPRIVAEEASTDGWISILISWGVTLLIGIFIIGLLRRFPGHTLYEILPKLFGKVAGSALTLLWVVYSLFSAGVVLFTMVYIIQVWILRNTHFVVLVITYLLPIYLIAKQRLQVQTRFAEFVYISTLWMPPLLFFSLRDANVLNILPIGKEGIGNVLKAVPYTLAPLLGFEGAYFLQPYLKDRSKALKGVTLAVSMAAVLYLFVVIISFLCFNENEIQDYFWPTLQLLKAITLPFIERFEIVFLAFYLTIVAQTIIPYLYYSAAGCSSLLKLRDHKWPLFAAVILLIILSLSYEPDEQIISRLGSIQNWVGMGMAYAFPILIWLFAVLFKRARKEPAG
ncbi:GerAB/ArcD/ProY family transporter [Paenibacillus gansuensis]|uniref:GerAB/ArcD/ProY family transporter n=1 Tax=Paenibacillus gansuensis TaxID=306542 RepID=A0ABW5P7N1_9BACL